MYEPLLFVHSWTRWIVLMAILYFFFRSLWGWFRNSPWTSQDGHFVWALDQVFNYQVAFGVTLWLVFSPMTKAAFKDPGLMFENPVVSFWFLKHGLTMIFALGAFQIGKARSKKVSGSAKFKVFAVTMATVLVLVGSAIPWPWLSYGRAFFRWLS